MQSGIRWPDTSASNVATAARIDNARFPAALRRSDVGDEVIGVS